MYRSLEPVCPSGPTVLYPTLRDPNDQTPLNPKECFSCAGGNVGGGGTKARRPVDFTGRLRGTGQCGNRRESRVD